MASGIGVMWLLLAQLEKFVTTLLDLKLEANLLQQKLYDLELIQLPPSVLIPVPSNRKQAL